MGSKTQESTSQQSTTPINQAALQNIYGTVANAAQTPYTPYSGELTAPVNAQQTAGINNINSAANYASPYIQNAAGLAQGAANPLTAAQIQQYQNPYTQNVVNATQAQFNDQNAQAQNSLKGNAAMQGALGGDRQAVAQTTLAKNQQIAQAPTIANLYANSYNSGLQTAGQQFQQNPLAAASAIGQLGVAGQNAALQGAGAQINAGTLQQQTQQAADTANYGQYQAAQGFPYQQAAFLEQYGLPSALAQGTTSNGTQTSPGPNPVSQVAGLGIAGAGLFLKDGGAVDGYAPGGSVGYIDSGMGYIPTAKPSASTLQSPSLQFANPQQSSAPSAGDLKGLSGLGSSLKNDFGSASFGGGSLFSGDAWGGDKSNPLEGLSASDYGYKAGGLVEAIHHIHKSIKRARGHYDDGGTVDDGTRQGGLDMLRDAMLHHGYSPVSRAVTSPDDDVVNPGDPIRMDPAADEQWRQGNPLKATAPDSPVKLPNEIINPDNIQPDSNPMTSAYAGGPSGASPATTNPMGASSSPVSQQAPDEQQFGHSLFGNNISDKTRQSLVAAGLGMLASRSPFIGTALGEGGLQGLKAYSDIGKGEQEAAEKAATREQEQQRIDLQAKQMVANLENQRRAQDSAGLIPDGKGGMMVNPAYIKLKQAEDEAKNYKPTYGVIGEDPDTGAKKYGWIDPNTQKVTPDNSVPAGAAPKVGPDGQPLTGQGYIDTLSPARASLAKGIAEYKVNPNSLSVRGGHREQALADATRYNPDYDGAQFGARSKAVRDFATGTQGNTIRSLDVAIDHLDTLAQASKALQNGDSKTINSIRNQWREQTGSELPGNFDAIKTIVGSEIAKAVVGGQNALHDRLAAQEGATNAKSPEQIAGVIRSYKALMAGQLHGLRQQYEATTGLRNFNDRLRPSTLQELERAATPPAGSAPTAPITKIIGNRTFIRRGDQWFEQ